MSNKVELLNSILLVILLLTFINTLKIDILKLEDPYYMEHKSLKLETPKIDSSICRASDKVNITPKPHVNIKKMLNLFEPAKTAPIANNATPQTIIQEKPKPPKKQKNYQRLLNQLSVNGVMRGDNPKAVIYNRRTGKTTFVSKGDILLDTFTVESIENNKIILKADNRNFFLKF